ncbi:peptidoglycan-binding domain-containing protein [Acetivibrio cellulolyticus]|uniref:peptidoglycan-binding domain-containing protein n=1 Tax=Acetivibrio cellulolyticus TaxID=35830 RepID=UPI0001E2DEA7|nr:peptidoglycan-binding domain-containing protein [Acetivibrio cellulolyticus]
MSQHYAGVSFDVGQNLDYNTRNSMRNVAIQSGVWNYVEPAYLTPTWVHFDDRQNPPACFNGGYPVVAFGSVGVYVLILQDALRAIGFTTTDIDGYFGPITQRTVINFQNSYGLVADGIVGCLTWETLTSNAAGIGQTATVAYP